MSRRAVLNAFSPAQEVTDPERFAGRDRQLAEVSDALRSEGHCPVLFGERGLGKTSLALQCQQIAIGSTELLLSKGMSDYALAEDERFVSILVTCQDDIADLETLQQRILNKLRDWDSEQENGSEVFVDRQTKRKWSLKYFESETTRKYSARERRLKDDELSLSEKIEAEVRDVEDFFGSTVLIVIDELDRVGDLTGFASFLKSMSSQGVKFMLVGIAESIADLSLDHQSLERTVWPIQVPRMSRTELSDAIDRAMARLAESDNRFSFEPRAKSVLTMVANGFPWFVHVIGQGALLQGLASNRFTISEEDVRVSVRGLAENRYASRFRDQYQMAVKDSQPREVLLRLLASWLDNDVPTAPIYEMARQLGVSNPATYRGHLTSEQYGSPIFAPNIQGRGLLRFRNEMFKQYIRIMPSLYNDVDDEVDRVIANFRKSQLG